MTPHPFASVLETYATVLGGYSWGLLLEVLGGIMQWVLEIKYLQRYQSLYAKHLLILGDISRPTCLLFFQGQLAGLCGNFDLKTINEMRTPENLELTNPQEFGSSWAAVEVNLVSTFSYPNGPQPALREPALSTVPSASICISRFDSGL